MIYDISREIKEDMIVYKNKEEKKPKIDFSINGVTESRICLDSHTGTHVDAPLHMIKDGKTVMDIPIERFISPCIVFDLTEIEEKITKEVLEKFDVKENHFVLLKTKNSFDYEFNFDFVYLEKSGAKYLAEKNVLGVGIDSLGIERNQPEHDTHKILLEKDIIILEGLDLKDIKQSEYELFFAPLKIKSDGASIRALLIKR